MRARLLSYAGAMSLILGFLAIPSGSWAAAEQAVQISQDSGLAAVYSDKLAGHSTAGGKRYEPGKLTAAHRTLPFGTHVRVTNTTNGKSVELEITDRGPRQKNRILDISAAAAHALGIRKHAMAEVKLEVIPH